MNSAIEKLDVYFCDNDCGEYRLLKIFNKEEFDIKSLLENAETDKLYNSLAYLLNENTEDINCDSVSIVGNTVNCYVRSI